MKRVLAGCLVGVVSLAGGCVLLKEDPVMKLGEGDVTGVLEGTLQNATSRSRIVGARVRVRGSSVVRTSVGDGRFVVRNLPEGKHVLDISMDEDHNGVPDLGKVLSVPIRVSGGKRASMDLGTVVLVAPGSVTGSVGPATEGTFEDVVVNLFQENPASGGAFELTDLRIPANPDGTFSIGGLGLGKWQVQAARGRILSRDVPPRVLHEPKASDRVDLEVTSEGQVVSVNALELKDSPLGAISGELLPPAPLTETTGVGVTTRGLEGIPPFTVLFTSIPSGEAWVPPCPDPNDPQCVWTAAAFTVTQVPVGVYLVTIHFPDGGYEDISFPFVVVAGVTNDLGRLIVNAIPGDTCKDMDGDGLCFDRDHLCIEECAGEFSDLTQACVRGEKRWDCDDDFDGQSDLRELGYRAGSTTSVLELECHCGVLGREPGTPSCENDPFRSDRDNDGVCDIYDRYPDCIYDTRDCNPPTDGGIPDASTPDAAMPPRDGGIPDAAIPDAAINDAGTPDAALSPFGSTNHVAFATLVGTPPTVGDTFHTPTLQWTSPVPGGGFVVTFTTRQAVDFNNPVACPSVPAPTNFVEGATVVARLDSAGACVWRSVITGAAAAGPVQVWGVVAANGRVYVSVTASTDAVVNGTTVHLPPSSGSFSGGTYVFMLGDGAAGGGSPMGSAVIVSSVTWIPPMPNLTVNPSGNVAVLAQEHAAAFNGFGANVMLPPTANHLHTLTVLSPDLTTLVEGTALFIPGNGTMWEAFLDVGALFSGTNVSARFGVDVSMVGTHLPLTTLPATAGGLWLQGASSAAMPFSEQPVVDAIYLPTESFLAPLGTGTLSVHAVMGQELQVAGASTVVTRWPQTVAVAGTRPASGGGQELAWLLHVAGDLGPEPQQGSAVVPPVRPSVTSDGLALVARGMKTIRVVRELPSASGPMRTETFLNVSSDATDQHFQYVARVNGNGDFTQLGSVRPVGANSRVELKGLVTLADDSVVLTLNVVGSAAVGPMGCTGVPLVPALDELLQAPAGGSTLFQWRLPAPMPGSTLGCQFSPFLVTAGVDIPGQYQGVIPQGFFDGGAPVDLPVTIDSDFDEDCYQLWATPELKVSAYPAATPGVCGVDKDAVLTVLHGMYGWDADKVDVMPDNCESFTFDNSQGPFPTLCVRGYAGRPVGDYVIHVQVPDPPLNDHCDHPNDIPVSAPDGGPSTRTGFTVDTFGASGEYVNSPNSNGCDTANFGRDVFYTFQAPDNGAVRIGGLSGAPYSLGRVAVPGVDCNHEASATCGIMQTVAANTVLAPVVANQTYNVVVHAGNGIHFEGALDFFAKATNDHCGGDGGEVTFPPAGSAWAYIEGSTTGATGDIAPGSLCLDNFTTLAAPDVFYHLTTTEPGGVNITWPAGNDLYGFLLESDTPCGPTTEVNCFPFGGLTQLQPGKHYYLVVKQAAEAGPNRYFNIPAEWKPGARNDTCESTLPVMPDAGPAPAPLITLGGDHDVVPITGTTYLATPDQPSLCALASAVDDVHFRLRVTAPGGIRLLSGSANISAALAPMEPDTCASRGPASACQVLATNLGTLIPVTLGDYDLVVAMPQGVGGAFDLTVDFSGNPANDLCASPDPLPALGNLDDAPGPVPFSANLVTASRQPGTTNSCGRTGGGDVWYTFTLGQPGAVAVDFTRSEVFGFSANWYIADPSTCTQGADATCAAFRYNTLGASGPLTPGTYALVMQLPFGAAGEHTDGTLEYVASASALGTSCATALDLVAAAPGGRLAGKWSSMTRGNDVLLNQACTGGPWMGVDGLGKVTIPPAHQLVIFYRNTQTAAVSFSTTCALRAPLECLNEAQSSGDYEIRTSYDNPGTTPQLVYVAFDALQATSDADLDIRWELWPL